MQRRGALPTHDWAPTDVAPPQTSAYVRSVKRSIDLGRNETRKRRYRRTRPGQLVRTGQKKQTLGGLIECVGLIALASVVECALELQGSLAPVPPNPDNPKRCGPWRLRRRPMGERSNRDRKEVAGAAPSREATQATWTTRSGVGESLDHPSRRSSFLREAGQLPIPPLSSLLATRPAPSTRVFAVRPWCSKRCSARDPNSPPIEDPR